MRAMNPKQAVIQAITNPDPQAKREERGMLAKPESVIFLKEKDLQYVYACVVSYISTNDQKWYNTIFVTKKTDGSFTRQSEAGCKAENRFSADKGTQEMYQHQPWLRISGGGGGTVIQTMAQRESIGEKTVQETIEGGVTKRTVKVGSSKFSDPIVDVSDYRFWVGYLTTNGQDVASVRMIPHVGPVEEDEVQDNTVLFLGKYSAPITFEFYSPSHALIATQFKDI